MKMKVALKDYLRNYKSEISLNGLGFFPDEIHPKLMHVNIIDNDKILEKIHKETEQMFIKFGYKQEKRIFTPHLTLVRIRDVNYSIFEKVILKYKNYDFGTLNGFSVDIIESKLTSQGPIYNIF